MDVTYNQIFKKFGALEILNGIDLKIKDGKTTAILGPNGSGKTTLIKCLLGMVIPDSGNIKIDNRDIIQQWIYRNDISYLPQIAEFPQNISVIELIKFISSLKSKKSSYDSLIDKFDLQRHLNKKLGNLSGGTKQKVNIVLAFMVDNPLLVLDEPTSGLDPLSVIHLKEIITQMKAERKTIMVSSHILNFIEFVADELVYILEGKVYFQGSIQELQDLTSKDNIEEAIGHIMEERYG